MDDRRFDRIESKIDRIADDIGEIKVIQARHNESLDEHMRRTDLLEQQVKPLETKAVMIEGALKLVGGIAVATGIIEGIVALLEFLRHV